MPSQAACGGTKGYEELQHLDLSPCSTRLLVQIEGISAAHPIPLHYS